MSGEGSIYPRDRASPNGRTYRRWVAQVSVGGRDDRHVVRRVCRTRAEAKAALTELTAPRGSRQSLGAYLRSWLDETVGPTVGPRTRASYAAAIVKAEPIAGIPLGDLTVEDVEAWLNRLTAKRHRQTTARPASPKTRRNALTVLRMAIAVAHDRGYVRVNVAKGVRLPRLPRDRRPAMTPALAQRILAATADDRYAAAYTLALCGLRSGEVLGLAWADVDLDAGKVDVRQQVQGVGRDARLVPLKTAASEATVPIPELVVTRLREHRKAQLAERLAAGQPTEDGLVFVTEEGYAVGGSAFTRRFQRLLAAAGLPKLRVHDMRHGVAALLAQAGIHPRIAQQYLRHANVEMTLDRYTAVVQGQEREAADALQRLLGGDVAADPTPPPIAALGPS
jgi:integrase